MYGRGLLIVVAVAVVAVAVEAVVEAAVVGWVEVVGATLRAGQLVVYLNLNSFPKVPLIYIVNYRTGLSLRLGRPLQGHLEDRYRLITMFLHRFDIYQIF